MPVASLVAVTVTPGRTAPVVSAMRPEMPPRNVWASATPENPNNAMRHRIDARRAEYVMNPLEGNRKED
jgi:hypothetical protein